jgi:hypothetical protein
MDFLADARRRAFSLWLRTGRLPRWARGGTTEVKYKPWHDQEDGRFTFAGTGRYFGRGGSSAGVVRMHERVSKPKDNLALNGGGASTTYPVPRPIPDKVDDRPTDTLPTPLARIAANNAKGWRRTIRNGYEWWLGAAGELREVDGTLELNEAPVRSRTAQRQAGRPDRRVTDDGGHYIAPRFNGPTEAFNHFAQDRNFNRGAYRKLEDQWASALRAGKRVDVRIVPVYEGASRRPSYVNVWFWIDGHLESQRFPNERHGRNNVKR